MNKTQYYLDLVREFRQATGLPISSQPEPLPASIACTVEELAEQADAIGDTIVTTLGIALQCTDEYIIDACMDYVETTIECSEKKGFNTKYIMDEIQAANLSKLCSNQDEVIQTTENYEKLGVKCYVVDTENQMFGVYCAETVTAKDGKFFPKGKLLKSINWREPVFDESNIRQWFTNEDMLSVFESRGLI